MLDSAVVETPPAMFRDGGVVREGFDAELDRLRGLAKDAGDWLRDYEAKERARTGLPNLRVKYNKVFGYFIEISKVQAADAPPEYVRKQTLVNAERFITDELHKFESEILGAKDAAMAREELLINQLRQNISSQGVIHSVRQHGAWPCLMCFAVLPTLPSNITTAGLTFMPAAA